MTESNNNSWQHFEHQADIGIRGIGKTLPEAFQQAALALTAVITDPGNIRPKQMINIQCHAPDIELLLIDWLNAIVYEIATRSMLFSRFDVKINNTNLTAKLHGEPIDQKKHQPAVEELVWLADI